MAKLTTDEWNKTYKFLTNGKTGDSVENDNHLVEIADMAGGRYLHWKKENYTDINNKPRERWEVVRLCNEPVLSIHFLNTGKHINQYHSRRI